MKLPDDMFRQDLLQFLTLDDIVKLDKACMNHEYRSQLLDKISGTILLGSMKASLFKWLGMRQIYLIKMYFDFEDDHDIISSSIANGYIDQFRFTQHLILRGRIRDDMAIFIISHCPCLLSIHISKSIDISSKQFITDHTLQSIAEHCSGLQSLSLVNCGAITDTGIISIYIHCTGLESLCLSFCCKITDASIISISENCTGLKELDVSYTNITDASLIAIAKNCTGLQSLRTFGCNGLSNYDLNDNFMSLSELRAVLMYIFPFLQI